MNQILRMVFLVALVFAGPRAMADVQPVDPSAAREVYGVLVMAHGGTPEWNQAVLKAVEPLRSRVPVEVAFGMADACSIQDGVRSLEAQGVRRVGVVRLFVSGESWYERTEQILGLRDGAAPPAGGTAAACHAGGDGSHHEHHSMAFFRIESRSSFVLTKQGLAEAPEMGPILAERARGLSRTPEREDVLVLAHGPGEDVENERWIALIDARAAEIRKTLPFHRVEVQTLREDWPDKRQEAEKRIRAFVTEAAGEGRRTIVVPFRISGFGPYAKVLEGLSYAADQQGLLPHGNVALWIERQAEELRTGKLSSPPAPPSRPPASS